MAVKTGVKIKENLMALYNLESGFRFLKKLDVLVGIPQESNAGHDGGVTNAELMFIHENGSPARSIPARPVIHSAISDPELRVRLQAMFKRGMTLALIGNKSGAEKVYHQIGMVGASAVQKKFGAIPPPNAPSTIAKKGSSAPLIDTGALRAAITYVVRKK